MTEFVAGDRVVSRFLPGWHDGPPAVADLSAVPGDGVGGYARQAVVRPRPPRCGVLRRQRRVGR